MKRHPFSYLQVFEILSLLNQIPTPGLLDNMIYDVLPRTPNALGSTTVNASTYEVECEMYRDAVPYNFSITKTLGQYGRYEFLDPYGRFRDLEIVNPGECHDYIRT